MCTKNVPGDLIFIQIRRKFKDKMHSALWEKGHSRFLRGVVKELIKVLNI